MTYQIRRQLMLPDYHLHTYFSSDSEADPADIVQTAIDKGIREICFTDHVDFDYPPEDGTEMFRLDTAAYFKGLSEVKHRFEDQIKIKIGVECGLNPSIEKANRELVRNNPFDFVIGSSHIVDGMDPYYPEFWEGRDIDAAIFRYYEAILRNVTTYDDYDVYGHLDYIRRYVPDKNYVYVDKKFYDITDMILKNIIDKGRGIELNTRGLKNGLTEFIPTISLIRRYRELGGEIITVGSDAHFAKDMGYGFVTAKEILVNTGFKYVASFEGRRVSFIPIQK